MIKAQVQKIKPRAQKILARPSSSSNWAERHCLLGANFSVGVNFTIGSKICLDDAHFYYAPSGNMWPKLCPWTDKARSNL
jgi:hypothetical protein